MIAMWSGRYSAAAMPSMETRRKRTESAWIVRLAVFKGEEERERRTEDEFLRRREHVEREGHFVLVLFLLDPFGEVCRLREEEGERGDGEEAYEGVGEGCMVGEGHVGGGGVVDRIGCGGCWMVYVAGVIGWSRLVCLLQSRPWWYDFRV
jgi:hypothetical protein